MKNTIFITSKTQEDRDEHIFNLALAGMRLDITGGGIHPYHKSTPWKLLGLLDELEDPSFDDMEKWYLIREAHTQSFEFIVLLNLLIEKVADTDNIRLFITCTDTALHNGKIVLPETAMPETALPEVA